MKFSAKFKKTAAVSCAAALTAFTVIGLDHRLTVRYYTARSEKINNPVRIALITDLHSCRYGEKQQKLIGAIEAEDPDLVLMSGDIFDNDMSTENSEIFLREIIKKFPCYFAIGNHECKEGKEDHDYKMSILNRYGIPVLSGQVETVNVNGSDINICGVDDPTVYTFEPEGDEEKFYEQLQTVRELSQNGNYSVLLAHRPDLFAWYSECGFDLVLSGHAHGGQWIIPGFLNGVLAPNQGLFPKLAGGEYRNGGTTMIVSRGLARESTLVPRFYNRPELVIVDLNN